jgi:ammonium transporter Rh
MCVWQLIMLLCFCFFTEYSEELIDATAIGTVSTETMRTLYTHFLSLQLIVFVGFGFLFSWLKKHGLSSLALVLLMAVFALQWSLLVGGFGRKVFGSDSTDTTDTNIKLNLLSFVKADYAAIAVLISFGAVMGKVTFQQLLVVCFFEVPPDPSR